jgi:ABC-type dipeptide/oligopeptide/nickel transport system permease component
VLTFVAGRLVHAALVLLGVTTLVFGLTFLTGDPASVLAPLETSRVELDRFRAARGLDRPVPVQYLDFLTHAARGDFGESLRYHAPAMPLVLERVPATLRLAVVALAITLALAVPLGILAATHPHQLPDSLARVVALVGQSVPAFWLGVVLVLVFAVTLHWLPSSGAAGWQSQVLPGLAIGVAADATTARLLRSSMLEALRQDFVRTAHAKGLAPGLVLRRHALRVALPPVIAYLAVQLTFILGNAVVVETIFAYPGMGRLAVDAIGSRDVPLIQAFVTVSAVVVVLANLLADLAAARLDPRIRLAR